MYNNLKEYREKYEIIMFIKDTNIRTLRLSDLMTKMEKEFNIPYLNDIRWNHEHKNVIELYRKISDARKI
jgi:hypothetical protein